MLGNGIHLWNLATEVVSLRGNERVFTGSNHVSPFLDIVSILHKVGIKV